MERSQSKLWFSSLVIMIIMTVAHYSGVERVMVVQAQDDSGIDAPDTYEIDLLGISRTDTSQFAVTFGFEGHRLGGEATSVNLNSVVAIQPDPPAYHAETQATGDLELFRLIPVTSDQTEIENELVYLERNLFSYVNFPQEEQESCGKNISGGTPAINRLQSQVPFPSSTFVDGSFPEIPRVLPDIQFGERIAVHYLLPEFSSSTIENGRVEIHWLPDADRVSYFEFEGTGQFYVQDTQLEGNLHYSYTLISDNEHYEFSTPTHCETPNVQGATIFEPSPEWIVRENYGYYITNRSIDHLIAFHNDGLTEVGYELLGEPLYGFSSAGLSYLGEDGTWMRIDLIEDIDGTSVEIRVIE